MVKTRVIVRIRSGSTLVVLDLFKLAFDKLCGSQLLGKSFLPVLGLLFARTLVSFAFYRLVSATSLAIPIIGFDRIQDAEQPQKPILDVGIRGIGDARLSTQREGSKSGLGGFSG